MAEEQRGNIVKYAVKVMPVSCLLTSKLPIASTRCVCCIHGMDLVISINCPLRSAIDCNLLLKSEHDSQIHGSYHKLMGRK
jgi:hypothetical protein